MSDSKFDSESSAKSDVVSDLNNTLQVDQLEQAVQLLKAGELVAFPTETVYGLGADASNPEAVTKIFEAKGRPADHPVIVHLASSEAITEWAKDIPETAWLLANAFWPGPLTLILKKQAQVLDGVTGGQDSVGLRVPSHPVAQELLKAFKGGLAAPSANLFGHISPTSANHVKADFGDAIPLILDGGDSEVGLESTIVDLTGPNARVLRPGGISVSDLKVVIPTIELVVKQVKDSQESHTDGEGLYSQQNKLPKANSTDDIAQTGELRASGLLEKHYAPKVTTYLVDDLSQALGSIKSLKSDSLNETKQIGVIACRTRESDISAFSESDFLAKSVQIWKQLATSPEAYARQLYSSMRELEDSVDEIWIEAVPKGKAWLAVSDRLGRATVSFRIKDN